jgi:hypothetical protein
LWCDNQGAAEKLANPHPLPTQLGNVVARMLSAKALLAEEFDIRVGWLPAEHNSGATNLVSKLNRRADELARRAVDGSVRWRLPRSWTEPTSVHMAHEGRVCATTDNLQPLYDQRVPDMVNHNRPFYPWVGRGTMPSVLVEAWHAICPLHPVEHAMAKLASCLSTVEDLYVTEGPTECGNCGEPVEAEGFHKARDCVGLIWCWAQVLQGLSDWVDKNLAGASIVQTGPAAAVMRGGRPLCMLVWEHPRSQARFDQCGTPTWVVNHAYYISEELYEQLAEKRVLGVQAKPFVLQVFLSVARYGWTKGDAQTPVPAAASQVEAKLLQLWRDASYPGPIQLPIRSVHIPAVFMNGVLPVLQVLLNAVVVFDTVLHQQGATIYMTTTGHGGALEAVRTSLRPTAAIQPSTMGIFDQVQRWPENLGFALEVQPTDTAQQWVIVWRAGRAPGARIQWHYKWILRTLAVWGSTVLRQTQVVL